MKLTGKTVSSPSMRRLLRWGFNGAAVVLPTARGPITLWATGLAIAVTTVAWVTSYSASLWWPGYLGGSGLQFHAWEGRGFIIWIYAPRLPAGAWAVDNMVEISPDGMSQRHHFNRKLEQLYADKFATRVSVRTEGTEFCSSFPSLKNGYGFDFTQYTLPGNRRDGFVAMPFWFIIALLCLWPLFYLWRRARVAAKVRRQICFRCGYDLRATPRRCPECGTVPAG